MCAAGGTFVVAAKYINYEVKKWKKNRFTSKTQNHLLFVFLSKRSGKCIPQTHRFVNAFSAEAMQALHHCSCFPNNPCHPKNFRLHIIYTHETNNTYPFMQQFLHEWQANKGESNHFFVWIACVFHVLHAITAWMNKMHHLLQNQV